MINNTKYIPPARITRPFKYLGKTITTPYSSIVSIKMSNNVPIVKTTNTIFKVSA